jgi:hypothetical protein
MAINSLPSPFTLFFPHQEHPNQTHYGPMSETVDRVFADYFQSLLALRPQITPRCEQSEEVAL